MLILEHANRDTIDVKSVKEVLYALLTGNVDSIALSQFNQSFSHSFHHMRMPLQDSLKLLIEPAKFRVAMSIFT